MNCTAVMEKILTPEQLSRVRQVMATQVRLERSVSAKPSPEGILTGPRHLLAELVRNFTAASLGRRAAGAAGSGATVQIPSQFVRVGNALAERGLDPAKLILTDAVMAPNPKLLKALLSEIPRGRRKLSMDRQLNAWAIAAANQYGIVGVESVIGESQ